MGDSSKAPSSSPQVGDVLAGKYRIDRVLGVGGMGVVVAAHHTQLDTKVAIKFLLPEMLASSEAVSRFAREARAAVRITSEHVARVLDVGTLETGAPYMVMEFLEGKDLTAWLQQYGALPVEQAVEFVLQACVAIAEAHTLGIVHRDLKPANLFCIRRADGQLTIKVLDFGISKVTNDMSASGPGMMAATKTNVVMGSPLYMSPEQMTSTKDVTGQTDLWALGIILHELLVGAPPFTGSTMPEICVKIATQPPPPVRGFRPDVPPGLEAIILRCLEKDLRVRFRNVGELAFALREFAPRRAEALVERIAGMLQATHRGTMFAPSLPSSEAVAPQLPGTISPVGRTATNVASGKTGVWIVGALGVLSSAVLLVFLFRKPTEPAASVPVIPAAAAPAVPGPAATVPALPPAAPAPAERPAEPAPLVLAPSSPDASTAVSPSQELHDKTSKGRGDDRKTTSSPKSAPQPVKISKPEEPAVRASKPEEPRTPPPPPSDESDPFAKMKPK